jgi:hypothetical protein
MTMNKGRRRLDWPRGRLLSDIFTYFMIFLYFWAISKVLDFNLDCMIKIKCQKYTRSSVGVGIQWVKVSAFG